MSQGGTVLVTRSSLDTPFLHSSTGPCGAHEHASDPLASCLSEPTPSLAAGEPGFQGLPLPGCSVRSGLSTQAPAASPLLREETCPQPTAAPCLGGLVPPPYHTACAPLWLTAWKMQAAPKGSGLPRGTSGAIVNYQESTSLEHEEGICHVTGPHRPISELQGLSSPTPACLPAWAASVPGQWDAWPLLLPSAAPRSPFWKPLRGAGSGEGLTEVGLKPAAATLPLSIQK